jgi:hypothetical protein
VNTCRLCGKWGDRDSQMLKYGVRHYAHLACLHAKGRAEGVILALPRWRLDQLRYFELKSLGLLEFVIRRQWALDSAEAARILSEG